MKFKLLLAILILSGCLGRIYSILMEGKASASLSIRDSNGFIVDKIDVPDIANTEQKEAYRELLDSSPKLKPEATPELVTATLPSAEEISEENPSQNTEMTELEDGSSPDLSPPPTPQVRVGVSPHVDSALQKKLSSLLSCKTRDASSRIPPVIWNHLLKKAGVTKYTVKGSETLPEISQAIFGEEDCWPKIWSQNPDIENPHELVENFQIVLIPDAIPNVRLPSSAKSSP